MPGHSVTAETPIKSLDEDLLGFEHEAEDLATLLVNAQPPTMLGLYSPWGSGKSSMLHLIKEQIHLAERPDVLPIFFDSWDHENPQGLIPTLLLRVAEAISERSDDEGRIKLVKESFRRIATVSGLVIANWGLKTVTGGGVGIRDIEEMGGLEAKTSLGIDNFTNWRNKVKSDPHSQLKEELTIGFTYLKAVGIDKVIFLIDDLDRCHPENIYTFLDNLRRLVSITESLELDDSSQGFVGVIAADEDVIASAVRAKYPLADIDTNAYLYKLLTITRRLPSPSRKSLISLLSSRALKDYKIDGIATDETTSNGEDDKLTIARSSVSMKDFATIMADYVEVSDGKVTLRHLLTLLRHMAYWIDRLDKEEHVLLIKNYKSTIGLALLGLIAPRQFKILLSIMRKGASKEDAQQTYKQNHLLWQVIYWSYLHLAKGDSGPYNEQTFRSADQDWNDFQHKALLEVLHEAVAQEKDFVNLGTAAKLAGMG